jgi:hypothetical protein
VQDRLCVLLSVSGQKLSPPEAIGQEESRKKDRQFSLPAGLAARTGEDGWVNKDVTGSPGDVGGTEVPGLPGARLRTAGPADAASLLRLKQRLDHETSFMLLEPGERDASAEALGPPPRHRGGVGELGGDRGRSRR